MEFIEIPSQTLKTESVVDRIRISVVSVNLGHSASFQIEFYVTGTDDIVVKYMTLSEEEYANWGADDTYIIQLVFAKYNLNV